MGTMYYRTEDELPEAFSEFPSAITETAAKTLEACGVETYRDWEVIGIQADGAEVVLQAAYDPSEDTVDLSCRNVTDHGDPTKEYDHHYVVRHYDGMFGSGRVEQVSGDTITLAVTGRY